MEYPNITVIGTSGSHQSLETVIIHEVGHNWFYGILGNNERDNAWMDEGLNTYIEIRYMEEKYPNGYESKEEKKKERGISISIPIEEKEIPVNICPVASVKVCALINAVLKRQIEKSSAFIKYWFEVLKLQQKIKTIRLFKPPRPLNPLLHGNEDPQWSSEYISQNLDWLFLKWPYTRDSGESV